MSNLQFISERAFYAQQRMGRLVKPDTPDGFAYKYVAGVDVAYTNKTAMAASVIFNVDDMNIVNIASSKAEVRVPYISGLLGFREAPIMYKALKKLEAVYDAVLVDGHGIIHPRKFGLACHVGILLNKPTIGVAKSPFVGEVIENEIQDECGSLIGRIIEVFNGKKLFVSIGHNISINDAVQVVHKCILNGSVEPLRAAHEIAGRLRSKKRC